jgi:hypothetical protein
MNKDTPAVLDQKKAVQVEEYKQQNAIQQRRKKQENQIRRVKQQNTDQKRNQPLRMPFKEKTNSRIQIKREINPQNAIQKNKFIPQNERRVNFKDP